MARVQRPLHPNSVAPDRATHIARMEAAARRNLFRPEVAGDPYQTWKACQVWAESKVDAMLASGQLLISGSK